MRAPDAVSAAGAWNRRGIGAEAEEAQCELVGELFHQRRGVSEDPLFGGQPANRIGIPDLHAARVVEEDTENVPLRNRAGERERGPQQASGNQREDQEPEHAEDDPVSRAHALEPTGGKQRQRGKNQHSDRDDRDGQDRREHQFPALEDARRVLEKECENVFESGAQIRSRG